MPIDERLIDPDLLGSAAELVGGRLDRGRALALGRFEEAAVSQALCGFANSRGGHLLVGADVEADGDRVRSVAGIDATHLEAALDALAHRIDPPVGDLLRVRLLPVATGGHLAVVSVRRSPRPPHLQADTGLIYVSLPTGLAPVRSRAALDALYASGRAERERAERMIESMTERLMLAQFGYFGLGLIACLQQPTADAYLWAGGHLEEFTCHADAFMATWGFTPEMAKLRQAEIELRSEREVCGVIRVARNGCLAIGETRRRPPGDMIGSRDELGQRLHEMIECACRVLGRADSGLIVPYLFCEGLKGTRIRLGESPEDLSAPSSVDAVRSPGPTGDARAPAYREELSRLFLDALCGPFQGNGARA